MVSARSPHAKEIDGESNTAHEEKLSRLHFWRVHDSLYAFKDDKDRYEDEEAA